MTAETASIEPLQAAPTGAAHPTGTGVPQQEVIEAFRQACLDFAADPVERSALFEAALVASNLRREPHSGEDRLGPLAQSATWGPAAARRDPYTAATVFLREARRLRTAPGGPRRAARLAARVQGRSGAWRHACAGRKAGRILAQLQFPDHLLAAPAVPDGVTGEAAA